MIIERGHSIATSTTFEQIKRKATQRGIDAMPTGPVPNELTKMLSDFIYEINTGDEAAKLFVSENHHVLADEQRLVTTFVSAKNIMLFETGSGDAYEAMVQARRNVLDIVPSCDRCRFCLNCTDIYELSSTCLDRFDITHPSDAFEDSEDDEDDDEFERSLDATEELLESNTIKVIFDQDSDECAICLESMERAQQGLQLPCVHTFHRGCAVSWFRKDRSVRCPLCRTSVIS